MRADMHWQYGPYSGYACLRVQSCTHMTNKPISPLHIASQQQGPAAACCRRPLFCTWTGPATV